MEKAVRRDIHKMHAFVRFEHRTLDGRDEYVAFYRPDHMVFRLAVPFFVGRFRAMRWTIFGPDDTAVWNGQQLEFGPGVDLSPSSLGPSVDGDGLTRLWKAYYAATFNPARLNVRTMRREMPQRFWPLLPEVADVNQLIARAPSRGGHIGDSRSLFSPSLPATGPGPEIALRRGSHVPGVYVTRQRDADSFWRRSA